ncbi:M3 family oligoendopeptidase [Evansella sp. AB-rgal1]|uniref:M3 family oligoendopeptidase n=1 Tax=Evansella sp. AB-rgal1 TaxID=3242696 RepID=UPI00359E0C50
MSKFYVEKLDFQQPQLIEEKFQQLVNTTIDSVEEMGSWLQEQSKLYDAVEEALSGHYIDFQCQSNSDDAKEAFDHDQRIIIPIFKKYEAILDDKFLSTPVSSKLNPDLYKQFLMSKKNAKELFRKENIDLEIEEDRLATKYFEITGSLTVDWDGEEKTLSQLQEYNEDSDRSIREKAATLRMEAFSTKQEELQDIMTQLIELRQRKADNSGLQNYRDYMFKKYERFDYSPEDCKTLATAIQKHVKPLKEKLQRKHQEELSLDTYRPWDRMAVPIGEKPLKPFDTIEELVEKSATIFDKLDPRFSQLIKEMNSRGMLDLTSRKGKAPGGFCCPLPVSNLSFIFMNAANSQSDLVTLIHEMGHCIHNDLKRIQPLSKYRDTPMESSELASMSMELLTMDQWNLFYENEEELLRAKRDQLKGIIDFLPAGIVVDQFQHWIYENPNHTATERNDKYFDIVQSLDSNVVDWSGYEEWAKNNWLPILHIFEVPFYYIEYVIAQLGAVQMYKQYKENPELALSNYKKALSLGSSKSLPEVYAAAGISFDFSEEMIQELMEFLEKELELLN